MGAVIAKLVEQLNSSVFVLLAILGAAFWVIYRIGKWTEKFTHHENKITKMETLSEKVIELRTKVDLIYQNTMPSNQRIVAAQSPISLTDTGKEIVARIEANKILEKYIMKLLAAVELDKPQNAYDIQMASMKVAKEKMKTFLNEDELNRIKQEAYSRGVMLEDVMAVFGVLLRNYILSQKGLPISDVDMHAK